MSGLADLVKKRIKSGDLYFGAKMDANANKEDVDQSANAKANVEINDQNTKNLTNTNKNSTNDSSEALDGCNGCEVTWDKVKLKGCSIECVLCCKWYCLGAECANMTKDQYKLASRDDILYVCHKCRVGAKDKIESPLNDKIETLSKSIESMTEKLSEFNKIDLLKQQVSEVVKWVNDFSKYANQSKICL